MKIDNLGAIGLNKDIQPSDLPPNAWTSVYNMRCADGRIESFAGHSDYETPSVVPYYLLTATDATTFYWVYMGLDKAYVWNGSSHTDITRLSGDYTGTTSNRWNGCLINGAAILNNGVDAPQMWNPPATGTKLADTTGWDSNWTAKVVRSYKDFLFALDITKSSTRYPQMVKWSDAGDGALPTDWDETSTTNKAGETTLGDALGDLVDAQQLRDAFIIYSEDAVYGCQFIDGQFVFRFYRISGLIGALAQDCICEFQGGHFVVGSGDVYIHDGQSGQSVIDDKNRDFLFSSIDADNYQNTFVVLFEKKSEIWICYPENGEIYPNMSLVWNYYDNTWYSRSLPTGTTFITGGQITSSAGDWDSLTYPSWEDWTGVWGSRTYSPVSKSLVGSTTETKLYQFEDGNQFDGVNVYCMCERTGLDIGNTSDLHTINAIYPEAEGGEFDIYVGSQMRVNDDVTWEGPYSFNPSTDRKIDCRVTGVQHAIRFESTDDVSWAVSSYGVDYKYSGRR
jgi:hypothetical protein